MTAPADWLALAGWAGFLIILVLAAIVVGRLAAGFFLRATGTRAGRR